MSEKFHILLFSEGDFDRVETQSARSLALAYAVGWTDGASNYGAGSPGAYVMPEDEAEMREQEKSDQVERALTALADKIERDRIEATGAEPC